MARKRPTQHEPELPGISEPEYVWPECEPLTDDEWHQWYLDDHASDDIAGDTPCMEG